MCSKCNWSYYHRRNYKHNIQQKQTIALEIGSEMKDIISEAVCVYISYDNDNNFLYGCHGSSRQEVSDTIKQGIKMQNQYGPSSIHSRV